MERLRLGAEKAWTWVLSQLKAARPSFIGKEPHFNFITLHYFWIVGLSLLGSVIIYGSGDHNVAYVDALVFATGGCTQAGLNTVDVGVLNTFQQVVIYLLAMMSNPITINSFVVFLRLYWFEKRFQHITKEARRNRGTLSKSRSQARQNKDPELGGVNGRNIMMVPGECSRVTNDGIVLDANGSPKQHQEHFMTSGKASHSDDDEIIWDSSVNHQANHLANHETKQQGASFSPRTTEIRFADEVHGGNSDTATFPGARPREEHIAILERQRNIDDEILRIPGPRDAERGMLPRRLQAGDEDDDPDALSSGGTNGIANIQDSPPQNQGRRQQAITIEEPRKKQEPKAGAREDSYADELVNDAKAFAKAFSFLRFRRPRIMNRQDKKLHHSTDELHIPAGRPKRQRTFEKLRKSLSRSREEAAPYLSWEPNLGRNSFFPALTEEQREELGGIEYRSLKTLAMILTWYFWGYSLLGVACLLPWILRVDKWGQIVDKAEQNRVWWGFFTPNSAFMDLGYTLTPDSMNSFNEATWPLLVMAFLIVIGNTGFPIMLRFMIWIMSRLTPRDSGLYEEFLFLLDHPRRCFTLLFPSGATWWLFWLLVGLNGIDLIFFIVLDLGSGPIAELPGGVKVLDGLFQAASTRTAGFSCVNLAFLHPAVQVSYMIMMYISVFPIAISIRRTNVYEEKSLGVYTQLEEEMPSGADMSYVGAHLRRQLSFDLWYIAIGFFILTITEGDRLMKNDFSMFAVLFEVVSAYGTVGMSLGYSAVNASLCSQFTVVGKLVIAAMMVRGRHRGLPYGLDRAILLPGDHLNANDAEEADRVLQRRNSQTSIATGRHSRGISLSRGRAISIERRNSNNIITSLWQPGPTVNRSPHVQTQPFQSFPPPGSQRSMDPDGAGENEENRRLTRRRTEQSPEISA